VLKLFQSLGVVTMLLSEILERLAAPVPRELIKQKKTFEYGKSSGVVDFIPWFLLCDLLDDRCGVAGWSWEIKSVTQVTGLPPMEDDEKRRKQRDYLVVVGSLTIHGDDRQLTREATGIEEVETSSYGDPSSNAEAMCLRRACSKFGLGRDLWRKEERGTAPQTVPQRPPKLTKGTLTREEWLARKQA